MPKRKPTATLYADKAEAVLDCGCTLEGTKEGDVRLYMCPMHAGAETMQEALDDVLTWATARDGTTETDGKLFSSIIELASAAMTKSRKEGG